MKDERPDTTHERWAEFRFGVVGSLLAVHPARGELEQALRALAERIWTHPITGEPPDRREALLRGLRHHSPQATEETTLTALPVRPAHLLQTLSAEQRWLIEGLWGAEAVGIVGGEPKCCLCRARHKQHSFAVSTLIRWYRSGADVDCEVPKLATYLGHNSPKEVYWYLQAVPELLKLATERSCRTSSAGAP